uniref:MADF domain-containing protein n=1 Tax=Anopheles minimus TaxID=112268 RepID=A0A182WH33_9DIPT
PFVYVSQLLGLILPVFLHKIRSPQIKLYETNGLKMLEEVKYIKLPSKAYRTISNPNKLHFALNGLPAKRHFVKLNVADFVNEIKKRPILYNMRHKDYKRICMRNQYWEEVAIAMNLSVQECKKRWRSMRDAFLKTIRNKSEAERQSWIHYRLLEFMLPYVDFRKGDSEVTNDYIQCKDNEGGIDFIEFDSDEELYNGPVTVSYVTQDGKQVFQVMHTPIRDDNSPASTIHHEETEEEIEDCNEEQFLQPFAYGTASGTEYLLATDEESEQESVLYEEQHSSTITHDGKPLESGWNEEFIDDVKQIEQEPEFEVSELASKRLRIESTEIPPSASSRPMSPAVVPPSLPIVTAPIPPSQEENKESDARLGITDPDERFLLSCAPILRRLPNKKNVLARLKIQQMLFELEYDEKYSCEGT